MRDPVRFLRALTIVVLVILTALVCTTPARADSPTDVARALSNGDVYISPGLPASAHVQAGDQQRLQDQVAAANAKGTPEKIAILDASAIPSQWGHNTYGATKSLRHFIDFTGTLVLVSPYGIAVSSGTLNLGQIQAVEHATVSRCLTSYTDCAVLAGQKVVSEAATGSGHSVGGAAVFWLIVLLLIAGVIAFTVFRARGAGRGSGQRLDELRNAASNTLSMADTAVGDIEGAGARMTPQVRSDYDAALGLRARAKSELDTAKTAAQLTQANQDAAQAVLALQGVTRALGIKSALAANPLDLPERRCFYCGRTDRPPYTTRTIDDGKGNSMQIEVCSVDLAQLERGRTPQVATVQQGGNTIPWWAVPSSPWYYSYGGPSWQYWLPFMIGMDVGAWYGGGFGYGDFDGGFGDGGYGDGGYGDGGYGDGGAIDSGTVDPGTDYGAGAFGGWGGDSGGGDAGGWGGDSGGGDWGGGDSGGGDSGGW